MGSGGQALDRSDGMEENQDTKEQFMMTNNKLIHDTSLPTRADDVFDGSKNFTVPLPDHSNVSRAYASAVYRLNHKLNDILFDAINISANERQRFTSNPFIVLKQMKYAGEPSDPSAGKFGAGAHTDWGSFTVLATDETPGLQIMMGDEWLPVPPKPGCLIINSGDQITQLTNGEYRSALHRVVTTSSKPRFSTAVFTYFNLDAPSGPLTQFVSEDYPAKYPSRTTLEYFHFKLKESFGAAA